MAIELGIWEMSVLALLREAPMHPYQMQTLLRLRHKDEILALKRGSLYHAIGRLVKSDLIAAKSTSRDGRRPERTTYAITPAGRRQFARSLREIIAMPKRESSEFMAAMSFLVHLTPQEALPRLEERAHKLETEIVVRSTAVSGVLEHVLRINLVESEYLIAMLKAELGWVRGLIAEISTGKLSWDFKNVLRGARQSSRAAGRPRE